MRFSFLLAVPAIAGAGLFTFLDARAATPGAMDEMLLGAVTSFLASMGAMRLLVAAVIRKKLGWFALYCALAGVTALSMA